MSDRPRVLGIGGVFLRARDAGALRAWYAEMLGIALEPYGHATFTGGPTIWSLFDHDTDYFGSREQQAMLNFRVDDLDAMRAHLRANGVTVLDETEEASFGRFGWAIDPEGNRFELWEQLED